MQVLQFLYEVATHEATIWVVLGLYFVAMLVLGWLSKRGIHDREGFLVGGRRFGVAMMVMHAFGAGTHPGDVAGVTSKTVERGASGIWVSWMWMFGTPFYWIIAPIVRRMRCLTVADYFEERFGPAASAMYVIIAVVSGIIVCASVLLATTRTVQGMMGKATVAKAPQATSAPAAETKPAGTKPAGTKPAGTKPAGTKPAGTKPAGTKPAGTKPAGTKPAGTKPAGTKPATAEAGATSTRPAEAPEAAKGVTSEAEADAWFFGILFVTTAVFVLYSYWGGIVAAIRTDMAQGLMIIALSFIAIPIALYEVGGWSTAKAAVAASPEAGPAFLHLFDPKYFSLATVLVLCINAPFSMMAQPHLVSVTSAGRTEWEGRVGFAYGNVIKRVCTMGWGILAICWLALLIKQGRSVHADAAFGDSVRHLLPAVLQGLMLACVLAAAMSTGDALQVTVAGLFSQNVYRRYVRRHAGEAHYVQVTRITGVIIIAASLAFAVAMRESVVRTILDYFRLTAVAGVAVVMGILWRRMNSKGVFASMIVAAIVFLATRYVIGWSPRDLQTAGAVSIREVAPGRVKTLSRAGKLVLDETIDKEKDVKKHHLVEWTDQAGRFRDLSKRGLLAWSGKELDEAKLGFTLLVTTGAPLLLGIIAGIVGSLLSKPPPREVIEKFFRKIYVPIGQEEKLDLPFDEAVPPERRLLTAGGLFLVKPSRQSWLGFLITLGVCGVLVAIMFLLLR